ELREHLGGFREAVPRIAVLRAEVRAHVDVRIAADGVARLVVAVLDAGGHAERAGAVALPELARHAAGEDRLIAVRVLDHAVLGVRERRARPRLVLGVAGREAQADRIERLAVAAQSSDLRLSGS